MGEAPGIPRLVLQYWAAIGFFLLPIAIGHTLFLLPTLAGTATLAPGGSRFALLATISWIVVYTAMTIALFRVSDVESLRQFFEGLTIEQQWNVAIFVVVFVNAVVLLAAIGGILSATVVSPTVGVVVAVAYPFAELRFALTRQTPAKIVVEGAIALAHALGTASNVTADDFFDRFLGGRNAGPDVTGLA